MRLESQRKLAEGGQGLAKSSGRPPWVPVPLDLVGADLPFCPLETKEAPVMDREHFFFFLVPMLLGASLEVLSIRNHLLS